MTGPRSAATSPRGDSPRHSRPARGPQPLTIDLRHIDAAARIDDLAASLVAAGPDVLVGRTARSARGRATNSTVERRAINLGTARALGLTIPQSLLLRAGKVIE